MAAEEIVKLKVTTEGDQATLQSLTKIDQLIAKINKKAANVKVTSSGTAEVLSELMSIADLIRQINQTPVNVAASGLSDMENAAQKAADAASRYVENTNALVPAYTEAIKVGDQVVMCEQQILGAAENRVSAYDKAAEAAGNIIDVEYTLVGEEGKATEAVENTARAQDKVVKSTENAAKKQKEFNYLASYLGLKILRGVTQNIKKATDELKAMNSEMVSIQKVTEATDAEMGRLKDSAFEVAGAMGSTPSDYLSSVTKWAQAGYKGLSEQLGELSAKTQVVGDVNEETANKFLLAVDAAYKYKGNIDALTRVLDGANEISNNYATSVEKLAGGMGIVSSLAEQAGMKVEETMAAIGTITAKTQESGNSAARALRALILNIQGSTEIEIDAETGERWTEDEIQRTAAALGNLNVATREYKNGIMELRNPMEVIGELSEKYQKGLVTEAQLQEVVASLGGKVRSNQLMALIQGYDTYVSMIETYKDAVGSADKELDIYLAGWEAKSNRLTAQWAQFIESFKATDISIGILDFGNDLLEFANSNAVTNLISQVLTLTAAFTGLNMVLTGSGIAKAVKAFFLNIITSATEATGAVATFSAVVNSTIGWVGLVAIGITALSGALKGLDYIYEKLNPSAKTLWENAKKSADEYQALTQEAEQLRDQLKSVGERMDELNKKGPLTLTERAELERLEITNSQLETQLELKERLAKLAQEEAIRNATAAFNKGFSDENGNAEKFFGAGFLGKGWEEQINQAKGALDLYSGILQNAQEKGNKWAEDSAQKAVDSIQKVLGEMGTELGNQFAMIDGLDTDKAVELMQQINEVSMKLQTISAPMQAAADAMERFQDSLDPAALQKFNAELEKMRGDGKVTADEVTVLAKLFPELQTIMDTTGLTAEQLAEHFNAATKATQENTAAAQKNANATNDSKDAIEALAKELKSAVSGMEAVKNAQEELKENGQLSTNTLISLLGKYSDAVNDVILKAMAGLATQEEISQALEQAYQEDLNNYRNAMLEKEMDNEDFYASWLAGNADMVKKLAAQYGVDAKQYKTFAELKTAIENAAQTAQTNEAAQGKKDRVQIFQDIQTAFEQTQNAMVIKAQQSAGLISQMYAGLAGIMRGTANVMSNTVQGIAGKIGVMANDAITGLQNEQQENAMKEILNSFSVPMPSVSKSGSKSSGGSGSTKSYYEQQIESFKKLEEAAKRTNQVLERSEEDTSRKRIKNLRDLQAKAQAMQKDFIARGLSETSDEVNQVKLLYEGLEDDIRSIYSSMADELTERHERLIWEFDLKANNSRTMEQIAADDAAMVEQYRKMQDDVHKLAEYYRSQGVRENDKLIQDLQDKWWEYEKAIRSMYSNLIDAFNDYIDESSHKIEELGRATGNVGKQIEIYAQRIQKAQETITALQKNNVGGGNNGDIFDLESQIWGDKDAIRDLQDGLWQELEDAFDDIFDKAQEDIDAIVNEIESIQDQMDDINDVLSQYDKELAGILKPINDTLEKLNEQMETERKRLEELKRPLEDWKSSLEEQQAALEEQIKGYYQLNSDGSMGPYIKGLDDEIDAIQEQLDKANGELDRVNDAWNEQKKREEEALALQKKQLAVEEAQKAVQDALLALQTARNERNVYTLKNGVWAWRADEEAVARAEKALADAEKAKDEAEKELQDYKEEQAHKQIVKRLEEQIKSLEEQKKLLDKQKDLINKQIDAIGKQISAINKQIDAYEKESQARQDLIQDLIDRNEKEKEAWEDHYEALKEQYGQQLEYLEAEKKAAEERRKEAQKQYDQWMDTWKDIQKSIETPARDISEILNDIARYGTPAMAGQVDRVTELLRDLGYVLEDVTSGGGYDPDNGGNSGEEEGMSRREIIDRMLANSRAYQGSSKAEQERLYQENQQLGAQIGAVWDPDTSTWDIFDYSGGTVTVRPGAYDGYSGYSSQPLTVYSLGDDDGWEETKARYGILSTSDYTASPTAYSYASSGDTIYNDDHSITINGMKVGSDMMQRPLSDIFRLFPLYLGS